MASRRWCMSARATSPRAQIARSVGMPATVSGSPSSRGMTECRSPLLAARGRDAAVRPRPSRLGAKGRAGQISGRLSTLPDPCPFPREKLLPLGVSLMILRPCLVCGRPVAKTYRGRCDLHRQTTTQRGYGSEHQGERAAALPGAKCQACGCTRNLQRDHRVPSSLGGTQHPSNKRWLCRCSDHRCHDRIGLRRDRPGAFG